ncbi:MAG: CpsD/CapB family tyrosine-protein kinase [Lagierella massiliensis]|nr:CpsD/CapB family tyrosine-protein kinase [Lagierella massiliensis]
MAKKKNNYYSDESIVDEAIRTLRTNIAFSSTDNSLKSLVITSSNPSEGKSNISIRLARSMAHNGQKVLLIDCDLRNPSVGKYIGVDVGIGMTNLLVQDISVKEVMIKDEKSPYLDIILTGPVPPNPSELLGSEKMKRLVSEFENEYDIVILDSPPAGLLTDAQILSTMADGTILVVAQGESTREKIDMTIQNLRNVDANILGIVFNKVKIKGTKGYGYGYGYGYKHGASKA